MPAIARIGRPLAADAFLASSTLVRMRNCAKAPVVASITAENAAMRVEFINIRLPKKSKCAACVFAAFFKHRC